MIKAHHELIPTPKNRIIGHRGSSALRPENTKSSFRYSAEQGLNWVEFDVQLSSCKTWVVFHDEDVSRTTNGSGKISSMTLTELKKLDAGSWFGNAYLNEKILTLAETLELTAELGLQSNIELKLCSETDPIYYAESLANFLSENIPEMYPKPLISSFNLTALQHLRKIMPYMPIGYLVEYFSDDTCHIASDFAFTSIHCDVNNIKTKDIIMAQDKQLPVLLYTINDGATADYWLEHGIYAIFTDNPGIKITKRLS